MTDETEIHLNISRIISLNIILNIIEKVVGGLDQESLPDCLLRGYRMMGDDCAVLPT